MLFHLFEYLETLDVPGAGVFQYISFRAAFAVITSLFISTVFGKNIIYLLQKTKLGKASGISDWKVKWQNREPLLGVD